MSDTRLRHCSLVILILSIWLHCSNLFADDTNAVVSIAPEQILRDGLSTVLIRGGTFTMGTKIPDKRDRAYHDDEAPQEVTVKSFRIGKFPVTAEQMCLFLNSPEARSSESGYLVEPIDEAWERRLSVIAQVDGRYIPRERAASTPANIVTWKGAVLFCRWLSAKTGRKYRLPSEAEWEFVAKGKQGRRLPWADEEMRIPHTRVIGERFYRGEDSVVKGLQVSGTNRGPYTYSTTPVGSFADNATPEGVMDMCAYNIAEWCANKYVARPTPEQITDASMDLVDLSTHRVCRGAAARIVNLPSRKHGVVSRMMGVARAYASNTHGGYTWTRDHAHPLEGGMGRGFRVVEEIDPEDPPASP